MSDEDLFLGGGGEDRPRRPQDGNTSPAIAMAFFAFHRSTGSMDRTATGYEVPATSTTPIRAWPLPGLSPPGFDPPGSNLPAARTGSENMQARYYDPVIGRFLSEDPVGFAEGGAGYFNRYAYVANDPVNAVDPTGEFINFLVGEGIGLVVEGIAIAAEGGDPFNVQANAGRYAKAGFIGAISGGIAGGVSRGLMAATSASAARTGQQIPKGLNALNKTSADGVGGAIGSATGEAVSQIIDGGQITDEGAILDAGIVGGVLGTAGSAAGMVTEGGANLAGANGRVAAIAGAGADAATSIAGQDAARESSSIVVNVGCGEGLGKNCD